MAEQSARPKRSATKKRNFAVVWSEHITNFEIEAACLGRLRTLQFHDVEDQSWEMFEVNALDRLVARGVVRVVEVEK